MVLKVSDSNPCVNEQNGNQGELQEAAAAAKQVQASESK